MKYLLLLFLLACNKPITPSINMTEFSNQCLNLGKDVGAHSSNASLWFDEEKNEYEPNCTLEFSIGNSDLFRVLHFKQSELDIIDFYKKYKK